MASIFGKIRNLLRGRKPLAPQVPRVPPGHRGIAMGSRADPDLAAYQERLERAPDHEVIPATEVEAFLAGDIIMFVMSSNVAAVQYHPEDQKLMVEFLNGGKYLYSGVTRDEALSFATAQSKGSWIWTNLRIRGSRTGHKKPYVRLASITHPLSGQQGRERS